MMISNFTDPDKGKFKDLGIHHSLDMWHGAKNLAKKLAAVSAMSGSCYYIYTSSLNRLYIRCVFTTFYFLDNKCLLAI